ncbi:MAG: hypothetical protein P4M07_27510 [Xanthobacteraceae bacterium]|nr:hypothetical protein [Xanthobacteraceae bacterium]
MNDNDQNLEAALDGLDQGKRSTLKRLIGTGAFVGPMIVSFTMADLTIDAFMHAASANVTTTHRPTTTGAPATTSPPSPTTTRAPAATTTQPPRGHPAKS